MNYLEHSISISMGYSRNCESEYFHQFPGPTFIPCPTFIQRYTYRVLQTIQMKLIPLFVWAERAILGSARTAFKFKYEI
jgi:hypothetical protein